MMHVTVDLEAQAERARQARDELRRSFGALVVDAMQHSPRIPLVQAEGRALREIFRRLHVAHPGFETYAWCRSVLGGYCFDAERHYRLCHRAAQSVPLQFPAARAALLRDRENAAEWLERDHDIAAA